MTNTDLRDVIADLLRNTAKEWLENDGRPKHLLQDLDELPDRILKIIQDNQEPLQVNPKSHTYLPNNPTDVKVKE